MGQNIGIAYGAVVENAIGGHGNDRINGNQASNVFTGNDGADTFIIADYSGNIPTPANPAGHHAAAKRAFDAMMTMRKIDVAKIEAALRGETVNA